MAVLTVDELDFQKVVAWAVMSDHFLVASMVASWVSRLVHQWVERRDA